MVNEDFIGLINKINLNGGKCVLEFGLQTINREEEKIIERINNKKKIELVFKQLQDLKINHEISLIFGLPNQTVDSFKKSVEFCIEKNVPVIKAFPLMLLRGTELYHRKKELGLIESYEIADEGIDRLQESIPHVVESPSFSYSDWKEMAKIAAWLENKYNYQLGNSMAYNLI